MKICLIEDESGPDDDKGETNESFDQALCHVNWTSHTEERLRTDGRICAWLIRRDIDPGPVIRRRESLCVLEEALYAGFAQPGGCLLFHGQPGNVID